MPDRFLAERKQVMETAKELERLGLVAVSNGNVSMRVGSAAERLMAITPTSVPYARITPEDVVVVDEEGEPVEGELPPSSETQLHAAIYQARPDVQAVIHTHSVYATVCAVAGLDVPPIVDEMVIYLGGPVRVAEYGFPSTRDLADKAVEALGDRQAVLLRNHGMVASGASLDDALAHCRMVERVAQVFVMAAHVGQVTQLPPGSVANERAIYEMKVRALREA
jgi:L-fuculose-phosphate aldolase